MDPSNATLQVMAGNSLESQEKKVTRPQEQALKCPRCDSINTKFCYYNNYSLSQPRYFCKGCKRYWTQGGTLRNVPVGGGCRKNTKRSSSSSTSAKRNQEQEQLVQFHHISSSTNSNHIIPTLPLLTYDPNDLTLAFASLHNQNHQNQLPLGYNNSLYGNLHYHSNSNPNPNTNTISSTSTNPTPTPTTTTATATFLDALKSGFLDTQGGISQNMYNGYGNEELGEVLSGAEEMFLPYEDMSGSTTTTTATTVTTTRQELCRGRDGDQINNRGFWNFPWQQQVGGGEDQSLGGGGDAGREYWNGFGQSWHGLVNSPLM